MTTRLACLVLVLGAACADDDSELTPDRVPEPSAPGKSDGFCPGVVAGMVPRTAPTQFCGPADAASTSLLADVNRFWSSQIGLCACLPGTAGCVAASAHSTGWIYANLEFVADLRASGSDMPAAYVYAHEVGHMIQGYFDVLPALEQPKELMADCLAGYYLGSLVCRGVVTRYDLTATLATACVIADGTGDPIADLSTHGTCEQRATSVAAGIAAYLAGRPALAACSP